MASTELYSSMGKRKKKVTFGQQLGDVGKLIGDNALSVIGMSDVIPNDSYNTDWAGKIADISNPLYGIAGQVGMAVATGGTGNAALSAAKAVGPEIFAKGGKKTKTPQELTGPTIRGKQYPKGTIVTNDPNDPRLQAFKDSTDAFNYGMETLKARAKFIEQHQSLGNEISTLISTDKEYLDMVRYSPKYKGLVGGRDGDGTIAPVSTISAISSKV